MAYDLRGQQAGDGADAGQGNYYAEGIKTAELKKRHGKVFAGDISRASGRKFYISS